MGATEVQHQRVGAIGDFVYLKVKTDRMTNRPILGPIETEASVSTTAATLTGFYRAVDSGDLSVDLLGGVRYVQLGLDFDVEGPRTGFGRDGSAEITRGIVGVRATKRLGRRTSPMGYGDSGGFSRDVTVWQLETKLNYEWSPKTTAFVGYRHFALEIDKQPVSSDVSFSGPVFAATVHF